jgi:hypothetical protein
MQETPMDEKLRCAHCGDVIGAYERLVVLHDGRARDISKAEIDAEDPLGGCYHRICYRQMPGHAEDK